VQIALHQVRRGGQGAPIDVIDEEHRGQQEYDGTAGGPRRVRLGDEGRRLQLA
jgi:hypothetical protein